MYHITYNSLGQPDAINRISDGASLPFYPETKTFDESSLLVVQLRQWEFGGNTLELSDRTPSEASTQPLPPDWSGLLASLRSTPVFAKVYSTSKTNLGANVAYTLLLSTLTATEPHLSDLAFALQDLKIQMGILLTTKDIQFVNKLLSDHNFPIVI